MEAAEPGRFAENIMHFARVLRTAGLPVGPSRVLDAINAVAVAGIQRRDDFYWTLHAVFVHRREQRELFDQAFHVFWRDPKLLEQMMRLLLPSIGAGEPKEQVSRRIAEALTAGQTNAEKPRPPEEEIELDAAMTFSDAEQLRQQDFESMSLEEMQKARQAISRMRLPLAEVATRRLRSHPQGRSIDLRATLRSAMRTGGHPLRLARREPHRRPPPLVILCDISGSMSRYSRMLLHFVHALASDRDRVHTFVFGTRLTNITRLLKQRDVDAALNRIGASVQDWSGGTRIGLVLEEFNRLWSRRLLGQGAVVLLITDGLDRDAGEGLAAAAERLHKSCRRLIWLNPLLRWDGFEPKSRGAQALLPEVDEFRPVHNLESLGVLADALSRSAPAKPRSTQA